MSTPKNVFPPKKMSPLKNVSSPKNMSLPKNIYCLALKITFPRKICLPKKMCRVCVKKIFLVKNDILINCKILSVKMGVGERSEPPPLGY